MYMYISIVPFNTTFILGGTKRRPKLNMPCFYKGFVDKDHKIILEIGRE